MSLPGPEAGDRRCGNCDQPLAQDAAFCRFCGIRYEPPAPPTTPREHAASTRRSNRTAIWVGAAIVLAGAGAALAILLASSGGSSNTTVVVDGETTTEPGLPVADAVAPGRYVQAGSFRMVSNAETERERLAAAGIDVQVISSDGAQELYPGFQVLVGGPFATRAEEGAMVRELRRNGVPSAFSRPLSPALDAGDPAQIAGIWSGVLDRSSSERPGLTGPLPVTLEIDSGGQTGTLEFETEGCRDELTLAEAGAAFSYSQDRHCVGDADLLVRPSGEELMLAVIPLDSDVLAQGSLSPG